MLRTPGPTWDTAAYCTLLLIMKFIKGKVLSMNDKAKLGRMKKKETDLHVK